MTTINKEEIQKFSDLADQWWNPMENSTSTYV